MSSQFNTVFLQAVGLVSGYISADIAKIIWLIIFVPSVFGKFSPAELVKMWPTLPDWFWTACGVWEAGVIISLLLGRFDFNIPLTFTMMGGVISAITIIEIKYIWMIFMPVFTLILTGIMAQKFGGISSFEDTPKYLAAGFVAGTIIDKVFGRAAKAPTKVN